MARLHALQLADQRAMERQGIRENPIRRSGYALQGGAAPTEPVEFALASHRAMEEQHNRQNPHRKGATPTMGVSRVRGGRAVPSSGLSQFRGGSNGVVVGAGHGSDSESDEEMEGGARDMEIMARESGRRPAIRSGQSDKHSVEAKEMGRHLGRHLMAVRGGGFFDLFTKGIVEAGRQGESVSKFTGLPNSSPPPIPDANASAGPDVTPDAGADAGPPPSGGSALFYRQGDMSKDVDEHHEEHTARRFGRTHRGGAYDFSSIMPKKEEQARSMVYTREDAERDRQSEKKRQEDRKRRGDMYVVSAEDIRKKKMEDAAKDFVEKHKQTYSKPSTPVSRASIVASIPKPRMGGAVEGRHKGFKFGDPTGSIQRLSDNQAKLRQTSSSRRSFLDVPMITAKGGMLTGAYEGMGKLTITHGGTRSKSKPSKKEKNPYGRTHTSELSLGMTKKVRKPAQAPPHEDQPDMGLALDLPPPPKGKGRRAPAGPSDGRRARAAIVKRVMAEKGMKMIEASKYVKEHNLY